MPRVAAFLVLIAVLALVRAASAAGGGGPRFAAGDRCCAGCAYASGCCCAGPTAKTVIVARYATRTAVRTVTATAVAGNGARVGLRSASRAAAGGASTGPEAAASAFLFGRDVAADAVAEDHPMDDSRARLLPRHLCPACPSGTSLVKRSSKGGNLAYCCPARKTVTITRTIGTKILTKKTTRTVTLTLSSTTAAISTTATLSTTSTPFINNTLIPCINNTNSYYRCPNFASSGRACNPQNAALLPAGSTSSTGACFAVNSEFCCVEYDYVAVNLKPCAVMCNAAPDTWPVLTADNQAIACDAASGATGGGAGQCFTAQGMTAGNIGTCCSVV
ncbi:hypothetical protein DFJ74DRAFT_766470 [Hyaloraphidium curvatum]|nr:hypothetical protein DFJ74DRAFT_766470 [Hyaloraphidium curvatum]